MLICRAITGVTTVSCAGASLTMLPCDWSAVVAARAEQACSLPRAPANQSTELELYTPSEHQSRVDTVSGNIRTRDSTVSLDIVIVSYFAYRQIECLTAHCLRFQCKIPEFVQDDDFCFFLL